MSDSGAAVAEDAHACVLLWRAVVDQARKHARGESLRYVASSDSPEALHAVQVEAQQFLEEIGAPP